MRYISLFSGVEAATLASEPLGWEPVAFCEVDDFPSAVLAARFPDVPNLGDVTKVDWKSYKGAADLVIGGFPCFTADTLVLCESGFKPIEEVQVGERVVTHKGRLRTVLNVGHRQAPTGDLKVHGMIEIHCTPTHPILTSRRTKQDKDENGCWFRFSDESFLPAEQSAGLCACSVRDVNCSIPEFPDVYGMERGDVLELIGWYLGDGSIASKGRKNPTLRTLMLSINPNKFVKFVSVFKQKMNYRVEPVDKNRCTVFIHSTELCRFIEKWFGKGAENKNLPAWVYSLPRDERMRLFNGYTSTDGTTYSTGRIEIESVSKRLVIGMQMLLGSGSACALTPRGTRVIKGVEYQVKPTFKVSYREGHSRCWAHNGYSKRLIESFGNLRKETVYNLEVEGDNSYTADGIAVHNCQSYSIAGLRKGLDEPRGQLMLEFLAACRDIDPEWIVAENVPGLLSSGRGGDFKTFLEAVAILWPRGGVAWRILDSQWFGVAQRRRRVFAVINTRDWRRAAEVLLDEHCLRGNTPTREQAWEAAAANAQGSIGENLAGQ